MKSLALLLAFFTLSPVFGYYENYYPENYQAAFSRGTWKDSALKEQLFLLLSSYHEKRGNLPDELKNASCGKNCYRHEMLGYGRARQYLFGDIHLKRDQKGEFYIEEVYCDRIFTDKDFGKPGSLGELRIPNNTILNCEHTWPQSKFSRGFNDELQKSDLHHLYPSETNANSTRGHKRFGEVTGDSPRNCDASKVGALIPIGGATGRELYFEPPAYHKGNVARAIFYFSIRYKLPISIEEEAYLKKWHQLDPVDEDETHRNERVFELQGNRNPFIDHPELTTLISDF